MLRKYASATVISAELATTNPLGLVKASHRAVFNYEPRPGFLYVRSRMISSRCNDNHDEFPAEEIKAAWRTAIGKPAFVNHHNEDHRRMRGVIIDAALHEDVLPDGRPDIWIEALHELDAKRFPKLAEAILAGRVNRTSMGCDVGHSVCSACGNKASTPAEYCEHIPRMKGKILYRHTASGEREGHLIREKCYKLSFFENSFLVEDPADPTAVVTGVDDRGLKRAASRQSKMAAIPHEDTGCPSCGGTEFNQIGNIGACHNCGDTFDVTKSYQQNVDNQAFKQMNQEEWGRKDREDEAAFKHVTPNRTIPHPGSPPTLNDRAHEILRPERVRSAGPIPTVPRTPEQMRARQELMLQRSRPYQLSEGPMEKKHLSSTNRDGFTKGEVLSWDDIGERHPQLYGDSEVHGEKADGADGEGIGWAASHLAHSRPDDPEAESHGSWDLDFHSEEVNPEHIDYFSNGRHDPRVIQARQGYEDHPSKVPPLVLVHRHGVYQVADGHHRAEAANAARRKVRAYVAYSPYPDEPNGDGDRAPYNGAEPHPGRNPRSLAARHTAAHKVYVDEVDSGRRLVTLPGNRGGSLIREDDQWLGENDDGEVVHRHKNHRNVLRGLADHYGLNDSLDVEFHNERTDRRQQFTVPARRRAQGTLRRLADMSDEEIQKGLNLPTAEQGHKDIRHEKAKELAESWAAPMYEPHGGRENYLLHMDNESMQHLQNRYKGGSGRFAFDEQAEAEGERAEPYYEIKHTTPQGRHTGWAIRHYADGPYAEIRHEATPEAGHDTLMIIDPAHYERVNGRHQPPKAFGHQHLKAMMDEWHDDEESGTREYLEGGNPRIRRFKQRYPQGKLPPRQSYNETKAPADVDTLRTESCPVCGETDSFDGDRCEVCHFVQPPAMFTDPDTSVARQMDLKGDQFDQGMVGPNGEPVEGIEGQEGAGAMEGMPGTPGDQIADLFCPACGFSADTQEPMTNNDPSMPAEQQGLLDGDVCPNCGQATMLSPNDVGELGGEVPQEVADDADADAVPDDQEQDVDQDGIPDDAEPDVDADGKPDDSEQDDDGDGLPDDAEGPDEGPGDDDAEQDAVEEEDEPQKGRKDNSRRAVRRGHEGENMSKQPKTAAAEESITRLAALEQQIAVQAEMLKVAGQQLHYLATLAGVNSEFEAIKSTGAKKIADIMNPAQPVPDPASGGPTETTQQAEAPEAYDDPRNPGLTPGSVEGVPAEQVDTPLTPGASLPTGPFNELTDVTAPVAGTETHVPLDQTKIETDVRVGDPMAGAGSPEGTAFPLTGPFAQEGAAASSQRTMASIRLARLRKNAGLLDGNVDELVVAAEIERTASLTNAMIEHEIATLDTVVKTATRRQAGRRPQGGPVPRTAQAERRTPSLVGASPAMATTASASSFDLDDASDLFMD